MDRLGLARRCGAPRSRERLARRCRPWLCDGRRKDESAADSPHRASRNRPQRAGRPTDCWVGLCRRTVDEHVDINAGRSAECPLPCSGQAPASRPLPSTGLRLRSLHRPLHRPVAPPSVAPPSVALPVVAAPPPTAMRTFTGSAAIVTGATHRDSGNRNDRSTAGYVVRRGDTLWDIAARHLGPGATPVEVSRAWPAWYDANRGVIGPDPGVIRPGELLSPPSASTAPASNR